MNTVSRDWAWAQTHATALITAAAIAATVLVIAAIWQTARRGSLAGALRGIAIPMVLLYEAQGLFELTLSLDIVRWLAFGLSGVACVVVLTLAAFAHSHFERTGGREGGGNLGPCGRWMWRVAVPMGCIIAASAPTLAGAGLRTILPVLSMVVFRAPYFPDEPEGHKEKQGSWRLTPRRLGVALGLLDPADTDLTTVHAERVTRLLTRHAAGHYRGVTALRRWHGWRFERLALIADDAMIAEAKRRVRRVYDSLASIAPNARSDAVPPDVSSGADTPAPNAVAGTVPSGADKPAANTADTPSPNGARNRTPDYTRKPSPARAAKMSGEALAPYVEAWLKRDDSKLSIAAVGKRFSVGDVKAKAALLALGYTFGDVASVTPIGAAKPAN